MEFIAGLLAPLTTINGWADVLILTFFELALGIDNLVFIFITADRLPRQLQHLGRRLGLVAAMFMRCILLCCIVWIMSVNVVVFNLPFGLTSSNTDISVRDCVMLAGGIYLIYKGIFELKELFDLAKPDSSKSAKSDATTQLSGHKKLISLQHAICLIMLMDIVFSLDSVITAAGLSGQILVMIIAVIGAVSLMIVFADPVSDFINRNYELKILALCFIVCVGIELVLDGVHVESIAGASITTLLYGVMIFGFITTLLIMRLHRCCQNARCVCSSEQDEGIKNNE